MRRLMTYPVGLVLKAYMAYAFILVEREKRREIRAEKNGEESAAANSLF